MRGELTVAINDRQCHASCVGELNAYDVEQGAWRDEVESA